MKSDLEFPSLSEAEWLNHPTQTPPETKGHPTLLHFWSIDSEPSKTNLPHVAELRDNRKKEGLRVIAVHVPCSQRTAVNEIRKAIVRLNLTEPCVLDSEHKLSDAFAN